MQESVNQTEHLANLLLQNMLGADAKFRDGQLQAICGLVDSHDRMLVVQRTGWGKSAVYFIATAIMRGRGAGPTLLISPLLSLMRNQVQMAERLGLRSASINSSAESDHTSIATDLTNGEIDILLVSPERLANQQFRDVILPRMRGGIGMFVIDEAHCISDWGHDFRPDYRRIVQILQILPSSIPVLATTATANDRVIADIQIQLGDSLRVVRGSLGRDTLSLHTISMPTQAERYAFLAATVPRLQGSGIIYCLTVADCERLARWLTEQGIDAVAYHGGSIDRAELEERLVTNRIKVLVATVALGMGFDKPDLGFVIHFQRPQSVIAYYQQVGRAGRAGQLAYAILLNGSEDLEIQDYFIRTAFPQVTHIQEILGVISASDGLTRDQITAGVNVPYNKVENALKLLEIDGAVVRDGSLYSRTASPWQPDVQRWDQVTALRRQEQAEMVRFATGQTCLMEFITRALNDPAAQPCGRCSACRDRAPSRVVDPAVLARALQFLRADSYAIEPRRQFPAGVRGDGKVAIPAEQRVEPGLALAMYADSGWGEHVRNGKWRDGAFDQELLAAAVETIRSGLIDPPLEWITFVPSLTHPTLVHNAASYIANALSLPLHEAIVKRPGYSPQKTMQNSAFQAKNAEASFTVMPGQILPGRVLLIDDLVDSRWTFTMIAVKLRAAGSGPVVPFALAKMQGGDL